MYSREPETGQLSYCKITEPNQRPEMNSLKIPENASEFAFSNDGRTVLLMGGGIAQVFDLEDKKQIGEGNQRHFSQLTQRYSRHEALWLF